MKFQIKKLTLISMGLFIALSLILAITPALVQAAPPLLPHKQDPRPSIDDSGGGSEKDDGGSSSDNKPAEIRCASLSGQVINWGVGGIGGIGASLNTGSWAVSASSNNEGNFSFGGLGVGIARLQVVLPPGQADSLQPLVQDAGVYLNCDYPTVANIALFNGARIDPPAAVEVSGPESVSFGDEISIKFTVRNDLPNEITNVIVTSLIPSELTALRVESVAAPAENLQVIEGGDDGQLVAAYLETVASGSEVDVFLTVTPVAGVPNNSQVRPVATLFYRESMADQGWYDLTVGDAQETPVIPETPSLPEDIQAEADAFTPPVSANAVSDPEISDTKETEPVEELAMVERSSSNAPPDTLPVTGRLSFFNIPLIENLTFWLMGIGMICTLVLYGLFSINRAEN